MRKNRRYRRNRIILTAAIAVVLAGGVFTTYKIVNSQGTYKLNKIHAEGGKATEKESSTIQLKGDEYVLSFPDKTVELKAGQFFSQLPDATFPEDEVLSADWSSSNKEYAEVDVNTGDVTVFEAGNGQAVTISVKQKLKGDKTVEASYTVKIAEPVKAIKLSTKKKYVFVGSTLQVKATCTPKKAAVPTLDWSSSNAKYATVTSKGIIKPKKAGYGKTVKITAKTMDGTNLKKSISVRILDPDKPMVAMTFDDGPSYENTKLVVDTFKKYGGSATFFVVGNNIEKGQTKNREILKVAYDNGNEIASHTYNHPQLTKLSASGIKSQLDKTSKLVKEITGEAPALLRPPYGAINENVSKNVGCPMILWSVDTLDWKTRNINSNVQAVLKGAKDGEIILMHDIHTPSAKAVEIVVPQLVEKGVQLVTVSELAEIKGVKLEDGKRYGNIK